MVNNGVGKLDRFQSRGRFTIGRHVGAHRKQQTHIRVSSEKMAVEPDLFALKELKW